MLGGIFGADVIGVQEGANGPIMFIYYDRGGGGGLNSTTVQTRVITHTPFEKISCDGSNTPYRLFMG